MSQIKADEVVQFFPTAAHASADSQTWVVPIHGWIFEPEEDDLLRGKILRELREALGNLEDQEQPALLEKRLHRSNRRLAELLRCCVLPATHRRFHDQRC